MNNLKIGDRVEIIGRSSFLFVGLFGVIVDIRKDGYVGVEFDKNIGGHDCDGKGKDCHCRYLPAFDIGVIEKNITPLRIRWYSKGNFSDWEDNNK